MKPRQANRDKPFKKRRYSQRPSQRSGSKNGGGGETGEYYLFGLHTVRSALENPRRKTSKLLVTRNAKARLNLDELDIGELVVEECDPRQIDKVVGSDAVHQGVALLVHPLEPLSIEEMGDHELIVVLDQITDPHNVGAIMRSAVALGAGCVVTTARYSARETGVLAKSASGALDVLPIIEVRNLSKSLEEINDHGFQTIGLDSEGPSDLNATLAGSKIALVLGAEGKGLRHKTRETCTDLARLELPGAIVSLNVSNAAAISLYLSRVHLESLSV